VGCGLWFGTPEPALGGLVLLHGGEGVVHIPVVRLICGDGGGAPPPKPVGGRMVSLLDGGPYQTKLTRVNFPLVGNPLSGRPLHHGPYW